MYLVPRTIAVVTILAVVMHGSLPLATAAVAKIEGTVETPCDPSRVRDVAAVQIRPVSGGPGTTVDVAPSTGTFLSPELAEGEYELIALDADGEPLSAPTKFLITEGLNKYVLNLKPPGCGELDLDRDGVPDDVDACPTSPPGTLVGTDGCLLEGGTSGGLKDWQLALIYVGVVGVAILALDFGDEEPASPF